MRVFFKPAFTHQLLNDKELTFWLFCLTGVRDPLVTPVWFHAVFKNNQAFMCICLLRSITAHNSYHIYSIQTIRYSKQLLPKAIGLIPFKFNVCWVAIYNFIQILKVHSISKQSRTWSDTTFCGVWSSSAQFDDVQWNAYLDWVKLMFKVCAYRGMYGN